MKYYVSFLTNLDQGQAVNKSDATNKSFPKWKHTKYEHCVNLFQKQTNGSRFIKQNYKNKIYSTATKFNVTWFCGQCTAVKLLQVSSLKDKYIMVRWYLKSPVTGTCCCWCLVTTIFQKNSVTYRQSLQQCFKDVLLTSLHCSVQNIPLSPCKGIRVPPSYPWHFLHTLVFDSLTDLAILFDSSWFIINGNVSLISPTNPQPYHLSSSPFGLSSS